MLTSSICNSVVNAAIAKRLKEDNFRSFALRSYISTGIGQFVDNMVFALLVSHPFFGWSFIQVFTCSLTGAAAELLCEVFLSPVGYKVVKGWKRDKVGKDYFSLVSKA